MAMRIIAQRHLPARRNTKRQEWEAHDKQPYQKNKKINNTTQPRFHNILDRDRVRFSVPCLYLITLSLSYLLSIA